jgi:spore maturation protein CgeB
MIALQSVRNDAVLRQQFAGIRVLVIGLNADEDSFEWHVGDSLRNMRCTVRLFFNRDGISQWGGLTRRVTEKIYRTLLREPERTSERRLLRVAAELQPDLTLVLLGSHLSPKTVAALRKVSRAPVVCWCQDQLSTMGRQYMLGAGYDAVFVKDRYMQDLFARMIRSTAFYYLPEACNPRVHRPLDLSTQDEADYRCELMIAGTLYYYRQEILQALGEIDVKVWGHRPDWLIDRLPGRFMGREVRGDEKVRATRAAAICLNTLHYAEVNGLNCRAFEIAGCGGFQLISGVPVLGEHFEPDVEVAVYNSTDELRDSVRYYLDRPDLAREIAERGRMRAHRDHTYEQRLGEILRIALSAAGTRHASVT